MKTYRQELTIHSKTTYTYFLTLGFIYLVFGAYNILVKNDTNILSNIIWIITGSGFIVFSLLEKNKIGKHFVEFNENEIIAKLSYFSSLKIKWNEITEINIKPLSISFSLNTDQKKELSLGVMSYKNVIELKAKLKELADNKGIEIT